MNNNNIGNLEIDNLDLFPVGYKKSVKTLIYKVKKTQKHAEKFRLLQAFSEKYTMLPEIWKYWYRLFWYNSPPTISLNCGIIYERAIKDFPQFERKEWPSFNDYQKPRQAQNLTAEEIKSNLKLYIIFPHSQLPDAYDVFAALDDGTKDFSNEYKLACKLYEEMKDVDSINDSEKFIEILKKTKNDEFIIKNIECQIAKNSWCKNLWITYIQYLEKEKKDFKTLLQVLKRYCRIFINDKKMKEKYHTKIEEFSQVFDGMVEFWIDSIKFELQFSSSNSAITLLEKAIKSNMYEMTKFFNAAETLANKFRQTKMIQMIQESRKAYLKVHPDADDYDFKKVIKNLALSKNTKIQKLPFHKPINQYLYDKFDHQHLQKLYQICKGFYFKYRLNLVHRFEQSYKTVMGINGHSTIIPSIEYMKNSIILSPRLTMEMKLKNLWITHSMFLKWRGISILGCNIKKVSIKYLTLYNAIITEKEFKIITNSKTVEAFNFNHSRIRKVDGREYHLEDILIQLPRLHRGEISCNVAAETAEKLQEIIFYNKIQYFNLLYEGPLNGEHFYNFISKNFKSNAKIYLYGLDHGDEIQNYLKQKIAEWKPENEKPKFFWKYLEF